MELLLERLVALGEMLHARQLAGSMAHAVLVYSGFFLAVLLIEGRSGVDRSRYFSRNFANDVLYTLFYHGGIYKILILAAVTNALEPHVALLQLRLLRDVPWPVALALFWIMGDLAAYWWHRMQHANRFLWALHSVHHCQEKLNLLSASRRHPVENLMIDVFLFFGVFHVVLGIPTEGWTPLAVVITCIAAIQHANIDWRFGPLYKLIVSPTFHSFHHSIDPAHANSNFAFLFSAWDYLFGTAAPAQRRPTRYGVPGIDFHESLASQLLTPFRLMWCWRRAGPELATPAGVPDRRLPAVPDA